MPVRWLGQSPVLAVEHFKEFDEFHPHKVIGGGISVPISPRDFSAHRAILPLQDSLLVLQRSFARRLEAEMGSDHGIGLLIPLSFHATINNRPVDNRQILVMRGRTPIDAIEEHPNTYVMVRLNSGMWNRGWLETPGLLSVSTQRDRLSRLQAVMLDIFCAAAQIASWEDLDHLSRSMQETLIAGLDSLLVSQASSVSPLERHRRLIEQMDELVHYELSVAHSLDDVARRLRVSIRTLHIAVQSVRGMSPHRYLQQKRLWSVRKSLVSGKPAATIKDVARANGFWHMGEFSLLYKAAYGESPSATLARSRGK